MDLDIAVFYIIANLDKIGGMETFCCNKWLKASGSIVCADRVSLSAAKQASLPSSVSGSSLPSRQSTVKIFIGRQEVGIPSSGRHSTSVFAELSGYPLPLLAIS
jgi:hypothetical protein